MRKETIFIPYLDVTVWLKENSLPVEHQKCTAYQKGDFYCVYHPDEDMVFKYPIANIWRISETYPKELRK